MAITNIIISPTSPRTVTISPVTVSPATQVSIGTGKGGATGLTGPSEIITAFTMQREIYPLVGKSRIYFEANRTIYRIRASLGTPPTGSAAVVTAYINGVSL